MRGKVGLPPDTLGALARELYACSCYHPLFVFNQFGDLERCTLRPGNVHSADGWVSVLMPVIVRYQGKAVGIYFRAAELRPQPPSAPA